MCYLPLYGLSAASEPEPGVDAPPSAPAETAPAPEGAAPAVNTNTPPAAVVPDIPDSEWSDAEGVAGEALAPPLTPEAERDQAYEDIAVLTEALMHIRKHYVEEHTYEDILFGALDGMLNALDPHSSFLAPTEYRSMREDTAGEFSGIGIHVGMREGVLTVIAPIEDSPAYRAGLQAGDRIIKIEGRRTIGITLQQAVKTLRGRQGESVTVTILRAQEDPFDLSIMRDSVKVRSIKGARILHDGIGYVRITQFNDPTADDFAKELRRLKEEGMTALVLDLRNNPGGLLRSAIGISGTLLTQKSVVVTTRGRDAERDIDVYKSDGRLHLTDMPVAVLVNGGSASASEIVAGAMQDHRRAVIVGQQTFGKASVQSIVRLKSNPDCAIRMTTAHYYTPKGRMIHDKGIGPDIVVELTPSEWRDVQLKRAYEENPELFPAETRKDLAGVHDPQLERAIDAITALRVVSREE